MIRKQHKPYEIPRMDTYRVSTHACVAASLSGSTESIGTIGENEGFTNENGSW